MKTMLFFKQNTFSSAVRRIASAAVALVMIMCFVGCGEEDIDWVTGETYATGGQTSTSTTAPSSSATTSSATSATTASDVKYDSPRFHSGKYSMTNTTTTTTQYLTEGGIAYYSYSIISAYTYGLDISVGEGGIKCVVSFDRIVISQDDNGTLTTLLDTVTRDYLSASTEPYYDMIGLKYTVTADSSGNTTGISGISELIAQNPNCADLLDEDNLLGVAQSFLFPIPAELSAGTSWQLTQYGLINTYTVTGVSRDKFEISIRGQEQQPFSFTDENGATVDYTELSPMTGSLYIGLSDRGEQEISSIQRSKGTLTDSGETYYFDYSVTSISSMTKSK